MSIGPARDVEQLWDSTYSNRPRTERVHAAGVEISVSVWDGRQEGPKVGPGPDMLLVHGGAASRQWWDHLAPLLRGVGRVVALDLSGHGDSQHREHYTLDAWSSEVTEVAKHFCRPRPLLVGHSMGGLVTVTAAQSWPENFGAVLALDTPLGRTDSGNIARRQKISSRPVRSFDSYTDALDGYKTAPPLEQAPAQIVTHIAQTAVRPVDDRWALKYDPRVYLRPQVPDDFVQPAQIPTWWVQAENGFVSEAMAQTIRESLGPAGTLIKVPDASHHLILEQPLASAWLISLFAQQAGRPTI